MLRQRALFIGKDKAEYKTANRMAKSVVARVKSEGQWKLLKDSTIYIELQLQWSNQART